MYLTTELEPVEKLVINEESKNLKRLKLTNPETFEDLIKIVAETGKENLNTAGRIFEQERVPEKTGKNLF